MNEVIKSSLKNISVIFDKSNQLISTEEATKNALVMPMLQALGYNVFNPMEVMPEYVADIGTKKGEKVDYALIENGEPTILIECKHWEENLDKHISQLYRYFGTTPARIGILTNGVEYRVFTDLENKNVMDKAPFFTFTIKDKEDNIISQLSSFHKSNFSSETIIKKASHLKKHLLVEQAVKKELESPSDNFIKLLIKTGFGEEKRVFEQTIIDFKPIVKQAIVSVISKKVSNRLNDAIEKTEPKLEAEAVIVSDIVTTQDELDAHSIIKAIVSKVISPDRVILKDAKSYCAILVDNNNRKPICKLWFDRNDMFITTTNAERVETKHSINNVSDIYNYVDEILNSTQKYL